MQGELLAIPGIDEVQCVRAVRVQYRGLPIMIVTVELDRVGIRAPGAVVQGNPATIYKDAGAGKGVLIADNLAGLASCTWEIRSRSIRRPARCGCRCSA